MVSSQRIAIVVGALIALVLQLVLAPYIAIMSAMPNFVAIYAVVVAVSRPHSFGALLPFVLGLLYDFTTGGPVGAMAFSLTAFSYITARLFAALDNDTLFIPFVMMAFGLFLTELSYCMFLQLFGYNASLIEAFGLRVIPCFIYDFVIAVVLYLLLSRLFRQPNTMSHDPIQLR